ncbi:toll/interleukin-1 receptor domain-containing protein [Granulicella sp. dw_53]|uniref:toll/interleukin-1 receptor domain-containing protein n=1 Tax=Granulicella sp. dw_53 TaxID=2719792 RepID=UPI001BD3CE3A|nr:toll/interleukin-1 receptor domain-containing protein [Granulicella sp. dw_53]
MKAFISHSSSEQDVAVALKSVLEELNIEPFLAHNDIRASQQWNERILSELKECDVFLALLSRAFKRSDWCAQESGAAILRRDAVVIIPISLDGTKPYGFLAHHQCRSALDGQVPSSVVIDALATKWPSIAIRLLRNLGGLSTRELIEIRNKKCNQHFSGAERMSAIKSPNQNVDSKTGKYGPLTFAGKATSRPSSA